jgi:hypothetical protein
MVRVDGVDAEETVAFSQEGSPFPTTKGTPGWLDSIRTVDVTTPSVPSCAERTIWLGDNTITGRAGCPACVTLTDCPAMTAVPVRDEVEVLACTLRVTVPLPVFEAEDETVIQEEFDDAVQVQVLPVATCT